MKRGGETTGEGGRQGPCGRGWVDGGLDPVEKFLSVKCVEPLDETSFLGQSNLYHDDDDINSIQLNAI